ncbi:helix-turn-helix transcriptional regulator [Ferrimicrobium sp.]|uniref:helix-turn-helix domain-containing protein n=1 Tax=Ferrimicrobium sp. TaxID=2926050 RepID=UPI0026250011|nr:helix-turn-helix transcriptional regulator [Ferrimicrobium sp.]
MAFYSEFQKRVWTREKGQYLRELRQSFGYTVEHLRQQIGYAYSWSWLVEVENASAMASLQLLRKIDSALATNLAHHLYLDDWILRRDEVLADCCPVPEYESGTLPPLPPQIRPSQNWTISHGIRLNYARIKAFLSIKDVGRLCGLSSAYAWHWERCIAHPTYEQMRSLDQNLGTDFASEFTPDQPIVIQKSDRNLAEDFYQDYYPRLRWSRDLGDSLARARRERGYSIAALIKETGVTYRSIVRAENNQSTPTIASLMRIDQGLGTSYADIIFFDPLTEAIAVFCTDKEISDSILTQLDHKLYLQKGAI